MNYFLNVRQAGRKLIDEQMININILYAIFGKKIIFASPNKEKMKDKVLKILNDNNVKYIIKEEKIYFDNDGKIEFI